MELLRLTQLGANDDMDTVVITLGDMRPRAYYRTALDIAHHLRMACKGAARHDRAPATFWPDVDMEDLEDCPRPGRQFRTSGLVQNFRHSSCRYKGAEVAILFDGVGKIMGYEDGIKLHQMIRRAGRRAKAWAGDAGKSRKMLSNLTNAEDDYRLGLN